MRPNGAAADGEPERELRPPDAIETEEPEDIQERIELYLAQHGDDGRIDPLRRLGRLRQEYERRRRERDGLESKAMGEPRWVSLGPTNGAGRMTSIAPHPTILGTVYAGAAGGGVWKTEDNGASWKPLTDDLPDLAVGALAIAPSSPDTIYLGTGAPIGWPGIGLLTSSDGGATWVLPEAVIASAFYRISVHPSRPGELVAGTPEGGLRSVDGGRTWTSFIAGVAVTDVVRSGADPGVLYAATQSSQIWRSEDGGVSWDLRSAGIPAAGVRLSLAISPSRPQTLYAECEISGIAHIYKSTDGAATWADLDSVRGDPRFQHFMGRLGGWANTIVVSPESPDLVIAGGVAAIRSEDGGASWSSVSPTHADFHDLQFQGSTLWLANDGGIWTSPDGGATVAERNSGLVTRQYYSVANDPSHRNRVLAGAQDNGTSQRTDAGGTEWRSLGGGDGFECAVDVRSPNVLYVSSQYGTLERLTDSGDGTVAPAIITPPYEDGEARRFHTVVTLDPGAPAAIYMGSSRVWRSTDAGDSWVPLPTTTDAATWNPDGVSTIAVSPSDPMILMVGKGASVYRSINGGQSWSKVDTGLPGATVNKIAIDPANASVAYAALATTSGTSVYLTSDGAAHWEPRSTGLPPSAALVIRGDPTDPNVLFCGTEIGVFRSADRGASWSLFGAGLPATSVQDLQISEDGSLIRVATYGRGVWELEAQPDRSRSPVLLTPFPGDPRTVRVGARSSSVEPTP